MKKYTVKRAVFGDIEVAADGFRTDERNPEFVDFVRRNGQSWDPVLRIRSEHVVQIERSDFSADPRTGA